MKPTDLRELEKAATPAPWGHTGEYVTKNGGPLFYCGSEGDPEAALIAALRNAAPFLLDVVDAARALLFEPPYGFPQDERDSVARGNDARQALNALDAYLRGER
jgi:hypothetical protein